MHDLIDELRAALPPVFLGARVDDLTGGAICWATTQNRRSRREIPDECFVRAGPRVLVRRDPFLAWWATTLREVRDATTPIVRPPGRTKKVAAAERTPTNSKVVDQTPSAAPPNAVVEYILPDDAPDADYAPEKKPRPHRNGARRRTAAAGGAR